MHMADALISPAVGGTMAAASTGVTAYAVKKLNADSDPKIIPMMGVMGAFVFAAQMVNFAIPGTGASGHIGGGLLLAAVLGPHAAFVVMTSVLLIQALFFADGGLLALGCNIFNLGFFSCYVGYNLIFKPLTQKTMNTRSLYAASIVGVVAALQLGAFGVVAQTVLSGRTGFSFGTFLWLMQPIHLAIGLVEGLITGAVLSFIHSTSPETLAQRGTETKPGRLLAYLLVATLLIGGFFSWFASSNPDGLEWSMEKAEATASEAIVEDSSGITGILADFQQKVSFLPDYGFADMEGSRGGTSLSGIVGGLLTLGFVGLTGLGITLFRKKHRIKG